MLLQTYTQDLCSIRLSEALKSRPWSDPQRRVFGSLVVRSSKFVHQLRSTIRPVGATRDKKYRRGMK